MPTDDAFPAHLQTKPQADDEVWKRIAFQFSELCDLVQNTRQETEEEAIGRRVKRVGSKKPAWEDKAPRWYDPEIGREVRAWLLLPFVDGVDPQRVGELQVLARSLIPHLRADIDEKHASPEFAERWGRFCQASGALELLYFSESTPGYRRTGSVGGQDDLDAQRRWFAHYFCRTYAGRGDVELARERVRRLIHEVVDGEYELTETHPAEWFDRFLNFDGNRDANGRYGHLTKTFRNLSAAEMRRLSERDTTDLPPLDWKFPSS